MGRFLGVAVTLHLLVAGSAGAGPAPGVGDEGVEAAAPAVRRAILLKLKPLDEGTVRSALDLALAMLASPGCAGIYSEFRRPDGRTPQDELERMGIGPEEFLESLVFTDGSREVVCRKGRAVMTATPDRALIYVCPGFARFQIDSPRRAAAVVIHESLHALGLGENPPSSGEITRRVERRCWKPARRPWTLE
jgi:hypothetical protein